MAEPFGGVWRGRRVLVTGHTGFKGGWLALWLARLGAEVHGIALDPPTDPSLFHAAGVAGVLAGDARVDVRDAGALADAVAHARPEVVLHLAAQPLVRASYDEPRATYETNVMGTVNLLEAVRASGGVRVCQVVTSDKCYENREWEYAYRENDALGGHDPYSSSKACAELAVSAWARSFLHGEGVGVSTVRAGNVIGGGDWAADRIVPDCVRARAAGEPVVVRNPASVRPWQHVLEPLSGYLALAAAQWVAPGEFGGAWNFGPGAEASVPVGVVVERFGRAWTSSEGGSPVSDAATAGPHEAGLLRLDTTRARTLLGWAPVLGLDEALGWTAEWYRESLEAAGAFDGRALCTEQIARYEARARSAGARWTGAAA